MGDIELQNYLLPLIEDGLFLETSNGKLVVKGNLKSLTPKRKQFLKDNKLDIVRLIQAKSTTEPPALVKTVRDEPLPLSFAQQRLWLLDKIEGGSAHYNMPGAMRLRGALNIEALKQALDTIVERHESLRTYFQEDAQGEPLQVIRPFISLDLPVIDISSLPEAQREPEYIDLVSNEASKLFDLSSDMMLRALLIKLSEREHILVVTMHHIASDGWSMGVLINEFSALYSAYVRGEASPLAALEIQYADYAYWQRNWLRGDVLETQLGYWERQLSALPVVHSLPLDKARPAKQTFSGATYDSVIGPQTQQKLMSLCKEVGGTLFMGLHAAFSVLLSRHSNETDIVIGTPIANREQTEVANLIGFFVNTLVLRSNLKGTPSFSALLEQSKNMLLDAYAHQQVPFEQIVEVLQPERSLSHSPLFQVMLVLQNNEEGELDLPGLSLSQVEGTEQVAKYDLTLSVTESDEGLHLEWEYNTDLFVQETIKRLASHFELLLEGLTGNPEKPVFSIEMLSEAEKHQQLVAWNDTAVEYPKEQCIHTLFEAQVEATPDAVAVVFEEQTMTYRELNAKANQLAQYLVEEKGVIPDTLVGICVERSLEMMVGILGVLKAGGAYVPLDPNYPAARLAYMLEDASLTTVLTQESLRGVTPVKASQAVYLDSSVLCDELGNYSSDNIGIDSVRSSHLAYVIYTSGSTGNPKGVMIEQQSVINLAFNLKRVRSQESANKYWGWFASFAFDASIQGISQLLFGQGLRIIPEEAKKDYSVLREVLPTLDIIDCTPSVVEMWFNAGIQDELPHLIIGGEVISAELWAKLNRWQSECGKSVLNVYGPTEGTVNSTQCLISGKVPYIGRCLDNVQAFVLDDNLNIAPLRGVGELHIGGVGLARGYLNRPELTGEKFVTNPFYDEANPASSERLYKTGDLVRYLPDGNLEFLGRIDHQVKIRGFRIELGEIERQLLSDGRVNDAVVVADVKEADKRLVAYVTHDDAEAMLMDEESAQRQRNDLIASLKAQLAQTLPDYMIPSVFVVLTHIPLTPNGKVDRKGLPAPDISQQQQVYVAPTTDTEKMLCEIWQDILGVEQVGITDNFFALGGHSLLATKVVANVNTLLHTEVPLRLLFDKPTLADFSDKVASLASNLKRPGLNRVSQKQRGLLSFAQQRLWLLDKIEGGSAHYNMPGAMRLRGALNIEALKQALDTIVERHESLRTYFQEDAQGEPLQVIRPFISLDLPVIDISSLPEAQREPEYIDLVSNEASKLFDLSSDMMLRALLIKLSEREHILVVTMHHIASDGWSMGVLINEFSALYSAYVRGEASPLAALEIQYADYAYWQRNWLRGDVLETQLGYWERQLSALPVVHSLPLDKARPAKQTFSGATYDSVIGPQTQQKLMSLCKEVGGTLFMGLHAAFSVLLSRHSNETDIVIGTPIANREQTEVANLIGFFVNTLVLRSNLKGTPSFSALLEQSKNMLLDAYAHQQVPFEQIVEVLQPERSLSHSPLFQVMLVLQNNEEGELDLPGLSLSQVEGTEQVAKYDLTLSVTESDEGLHLEWEYNTDLFVQETIKRLASHFELLLEGLTGNPEKPVFSIEMLSEAEKHQQLVAWNDTAVEYPKEQCIHTLFEAQVEATPDAVAVVFEEQTMTYRELNAKANQLAQYLVEEKGVIPDTLVGICVERSLEMMVGILGVLKAGGAYVPLDPNYPAARLAYMLEDASLTTVLTQESLRGVTPVKASQAVYLDSSVLCDELGNYSSDNIGIDSVRSSHLAYVIYTSGSTGNPKGVMIEHRSAHGLIAWAKKHYGEAQLKAVLASTSMCFDLSIFEFFAPLSTGGKVVLVKNAFDLPAAYVEDLTLINTVPSVIESLLLELDFSMDGKVLNLAGEPLKQSLVERLYNKGFSLVYDLYGPSECTTYSTCIERKVNGIASIGSPISNLQCYILHENSLLPTGGVGELYIGGVGLARGYLNRPELTDEKFVTNPFYDEANPASSERLYKTGDLVRYLPDGNLEFLGRIDHQVKIRGFRIELGEIEQQLLSDGRVNDAVVVADVKEADKRLVAYVTHDDAEAMLMDEESAQRQRNDLIASLKAQLAQTLPDYMIPSVFVVLTHMPLTPNGKVDRKGLPAPDISQQQQVYVAPTTDTEKMLCEIWQDILGVEQVGITDNFFALGGHSLLATKVVANVNTLLHTEVPLRLLFDKPTLADFSDKVASLASNLKRPGLNRVSQKQRGLLSFAQQRLWLLDKIEGGSAHYNMPGAMRLRGALNIEALKQALDTIVERHESLRTYFQEDAQGEPLQVIRPFISLDLPVIDISSLPEAQREPEYIDLVSNEASKLFDLSSDMMLRALLIKLSEREHILVVTMHHIASDGWSMGVLINEFSALYSAYVRGEASPLAALEIQYADYAYWQRNWLRGDVLETQLGYWERQLSALPVVHSLPLDKARPAKQTFSGATYDSVIGPQTQQKLMSLCKEVGGTLFMGLHAAFSVLLSRHSNETDIVIGTPIANREQTEVANLIGFFVNTLVLRSNLKGTPSFSALLEQSKNMLLDAYAHQQVPFEQIVEVLQPERSLSHSPLFQVMLVLQNNEEGELDLPGLSLSQVEGTEQVAKYDLTLSVTESDEGLHLEWEYNTDLFVQETIKRLASHFELLLEGLTGNPEKPVFSIEMLSEAEKHQQLVAWNDTAVEYPKEQCIHTLFEAQVEATPDAVAVVFEEQTMTYRELNAKANQLAQYLVEEKGVIPDTLVGICVERSLEMMVGILGVLKAGGAYVPLDPNYPAARLAYMLEDASLTTVLTQESLRGVTPVKASQAVYLDSSVLCDELGNYSSDNIGIDSVRSSHLAYVIYTSGSTGNPKGVMIEHSHATNMAISQIDIFDVKHTSRVLGFASFSFDAAVFEWMMALLNGACLYICSEHERANITALESILVHKQITHATIPPAVLKFIDVNLEYDFTSLIVAGESIDKHLSDLWSAKCRMYNAYGPTETAVCASVAQIKPGMSVHIGKSIANVQLYVMKEGNLIPAGAAGELHIGGVGLARGYLNRPELTDEKFVTNPFYDEANPASSERLYKTGDLVRYLPDGNLEFLGRIDHQVKIRGFRIELGEIERQLLSDGRVNDAVVVADVKEADKRLVAYVTHDDAEAMLMDEESAQRQRNDLIASLKAQLAQTLPDYMIPSVFVVLTHIPLTPNGKVDRKGLPAPDISQQQQVYVAPTTDTEKMLCEIWQDILGVEQVGITDNFFALGGHSLLATKVVANVNTLLHTEVPLRLLFDKPTLADFSDKVASLASNLKRPGLNRVSQKQRGLLSFAQQRLWLLDKIEGGSAHYNMPGAMRLRGALNIEALKQALDTIVERHESLRTYFQEDAQGEPLQVIRPFISLDLPVIDISSLPEAQREPEYIDLVSNEASKLFDLSSDMMLRALLIKLSEREHILVVTMHHIASDGWSMGVLINEFSALYSAYVRGEASPLAALEIQYADYAYWQRNWLRGDVLETQLGYWERQLSALPVVHSLPLDKARPAKQTFSGATYDSVIGPQTQQKLMSLCKEVGGTLFMGLHAAFSVLLSRHSNETDIVIGTPIANREQTEVANLIGFFVNTLVLRSNLKGTPSFSALLEQSKNMLLDAYAHQQVPFEQIVEVLQPERSLSHSPLFQVMLVLQNNEEGELDLPGLSLSQVEGTEQVAKYDLTLSVTESDEGLHLEWEYNTDLFVQETIKRLASHFELLLEGLTGNPEKPVFSIEMLSEAEKHQQLVAWNDTAVEYPKEQCIHTLFEAQVEATPDAVAVVFEEQTMTYRELNAKANQLAQYLVEEKGVIPDTLVGICVERSLEMMVGILGVLKAGGAYVPLDPNYPAARLAYMLEDASLTTVLTQESLRGVTPVKASQAVYLDSSVLCDELGNYSSDNIGIDSVRSSHLAYVIYTSGSTGNPKGVMIEHSHATNMAISQIDIFDVKHTSRVLGFASFSFDAAVSEWMMALLNGACLYICSEHERANITALESILVHKQITHATIPPAVLKFIDVNLEYDFTSLIVAGESIDKHLSDLWSAKCRMYNAYGPTETAVCASVAQIKPGMSVHIGKSIANVQLYVMKEGNLIPAGAAGELHIGGVGLARGYLNRPELTDEKFVTNPFYDEANPASSERLYKTGDLVRYLPDGNLEFLGRIDHQVKIRGFRIELGEIEQQLLSDGRVNDAVVVADVKEADKRLVAYVTHDDAEAMLMDEESAQRQRNDLIASLKAQLAQTLPDYMIPSVFVVLTHMPLTPNGKVDRKGLPAPDISQQQQVYVAPTTDTEKMLCEIWQDILGVEQVGITDNFFALGGHSLLAIKAVSKVNLELKQDIVVRDIFSFPTIQSLSFAMGTKRVSYGQLCQPLNIMAQESERSDIEALFIIHAVDGDIVSYRQLLASLEIDMPIYGLVSQALQEREAPSGIEDISLISERYIKQIKSVQATGPYFLMGWSMGGVIAMEIANQLISAGDHVTFVGLIDSVWQVGKNLTPNQLFINKMGEGKSDLTFYSQKLESDKGLLAKFDDGFNIWQMSRVNGMTIEQTRDIVLANILCVEKHKLQMNNKIEQLQYFSATENQSDQSLKVQSALKKCFEERVDIHEVTADHFSIMEKPSSEIVAKSISQLVSHKK
ncbi:non-ribosomal peptide synthetase [Pseudoalteromonas luteoviolacea]|uniref:non-ribosomal peptide synthetase n=1 Tax=Pseudoalteromonas luteoviolacea TaxID=43657 RepID=UPI001151EF71|nr:non-ribosomal peptide synthetase [Pseudoalteromonas luteoviolacea]TQF71321.1 amino acid adenylation domain-containing protein [Pseudoalteromonas luteoviolacea]